jgi:hypothetical protein
VTPLLKSSTYLILWTLDLNTTATAVTGSRDSGRGSEHACIACCNIDRFSCHGDGVFGDTGVGAQEVVNNVKDGGAAPTHFK